MAQSITVQFTINIDLSKTKIITITRILEIQSVARLIKSQSSNANPMGNPVSLAYIS